MDKLVVQDDRRSARMAWSSHRVQARRDLERVDPSPRYGILGDWQLPSRPPAAPGAGSATVAASQHQPQGAATSESSRAGGAEAHASW